MPHSTDFCSIPDALAELKAGRMIVLVDDEHRENEGDLVMAAEAVTPEAVNFMIRHACGRLCVAMSPGRTPTGSGWNSCPASHLDPAATPFTHNFDARHGVTTGISAVRPLPHDSGVRRPDERPARPRPRQGPHGRPRSPGPAACWSGPGTPRAASTCAGSPGFREVGGHLRGPQRRRHDGPPAGPARSSATSTA